MSTGNWWEKTGTAQVATVAQQHLAFGYSEVIPTDQPTIPRTIPAPQQVLRELPGDGADRKEHPITTGVLDYFPLALAEVARTSKAGNDQHNPGQPLHWARGKSVDHPDCITRHLIQRGTLDTDGIRHSAKVAWRALALLQEELEYAAGYDPLEKHHA